MADIDQLILDIEEKLLTLIKNESNIDTMGSLIRTFDDFEHAVATKRDTNS